MGSESSKNEMLWTVITQGTLHMGLENAVYQPPSDGQKAFLIFSKESLAKEYIASIKDSSAFTPYPAPRDLLGFLQLLALNGTKRVASDFSKNNELNHIRNISDVISDIEHRRHSSHPETGSNE